MAIEFDCEQCGKSLRVRDDLAGKRIKCPACAAVIVVPQELQTSPPARPLRSAAVRPVNDEDRASRRRDEDDEQELPRRRARPLSEDDEDD
ncbi:MAG: hypothetical protein SNJ75_17655, partial [Gemmataceae bacterium]